MPAYSYKERFVPFVKEGSKPHTIRSRRKNPAKKGDTLYHYFGLRTKFCTKLREDICTGVKGISIEERFGIILFDFALDKDEIELAKLDPVNCKLPDFQILTDKERDLLAWRDGFRPDGSSEKNPSGSFYLMMRFWKQTHALPFVGDIIYWDPKASEKSTSKTFSDRNTLETTHY